MKIHDSLVLLSVITIHAVTETDDQETNPYQGKERSTRTETKDGANDGKDVGQEATATPEGKCRNPMDTVLGANSPSDKVDQRRSTDRQYIRIIRSRSSSVPYMYYPMPLFCQSRTSGQAALCRSSSSGVLSGTLDRVQLTQLSFTGS